MAIAIRSVPTMLTVIGRTRAELRDPAVEADGTVRPESDRGWTDAEILLKLEEATVGLQAKAMLLGAPEFIHELTLTSTDGDVTLPSDLWGGRVIDMKAVIGGSLLNMVRGHDTAGDDEVYGGSSTFYRWYDLSAAITGADFGAPHSRIRINPGYTGTVMVRYWNPAVVATSTGDQHTLNRVWMELVALQAAFNILSPDEDFTSQQLMRLNDGMKSFLQYVAPNQARVRRIPR